MLKFIEIKKKVDILWTYIMLLKFLHKLCIPTGGSEVKASACNAGDLDSIPGLGRSPGEGNGNPLQYSCLENPMDWGAWWATVHWVAKSRTRLSDFNFTFTFTFHKEKILELRVYSTYCRENLENFPCNIFQMFWVSKGKITPVKNI